MKKNGKTTIEKKTILKEAKKINKKASKTNEKYAFYEIIYKKKMKKKQM